MAWGGIATRGSATEQSADNSISISPSADLTVGKIVFVNVVIDNIATADGDSSTISLADSQGNVWTKIAEKTETDGVAADGVTVATFVSHITTQISTTDSITATTTTNTTDKIISIFEATVAAGHTFAIGQIAVGQAAISASVSSLPYKEYLLIGHGGAEGTDNTKTPDSDYTERFDLRTNSSGSAITQHVVTRIASLTSDTCTSSAWTNTNPEFLLIALYETPKGFQYNVGRRPILSHVTHDNPLRRGLVFDCPIFEGGGSTVLDIAGKRKGTLANGATWGTSPFGRVLQFSGAAGNENDVVSFATLANQDSLTKVTLEVLVRPFTDSAATNPKILVKKSGSSSSTRRLALNIENTNKFEFQAGWSTLSGFWEFGAIRYNEWYHVVVVYDFGSTSNDPTCYINGVPVTPSETQGPSGSVNSDDGNFYIGNSSGADSGFDGQVALVRYWNRNLNRQEVAALYENPWRIYQDQVAVYGVADIITPIGIGDAGSGEDVLALLGLIPSTDSGAGVDAPGILALVPESDEGEGDDDPVGMYLLDETDEGEGVDAVALLAFIPITDSGSGSDAVAVLAMIPIEDTGEGDDDVSWIGIYAISDSGEGDETLDLLAIVPIPDTGSGVDTPTVSVFLSVTDSGSGSDNIAILAFVSQTDTGSGEDTIVALVAIDLTDGGEGDETVSWIGLVGIGDTGSGSDAVSILAFVPITDSATGEDTALAFVSIEISDSGSGVDAVSVLAFIPVTDSGLGADVVSILALIPQSDTGSGNDAVDILASMGITDSGSGIDALSVLAILALADTGSGSDALSVLAEIAQSDSATAAEALSILAFIAVSDSAAGSEALHILATIAQSDSASAVDAVGILALIAISDAATADEAIVLTSGPEVSDEGEGLDQEAILALISQSEGGTGSDAVGVVGSANIVDSGVASEVLAVLAMVALAETAAGIDSVNVRILEAIARMRTVLGQRGNLTVLSKRIGRVILKHR